MRIRILEGIRFISIPWFMDGTSGGQSEGQKFWSRRPVVKHGPSRVGSGSRQCPSGRGVGNQEMEVNIIIIIMVIIVEQS